MMVDNKSDIDGAEEVSVDADAEIKRLAGLSPIQYQRERKKAAKRLGIDQIGVLDDEVIRGRKTNGDGQESEKSSRSILLREIKPWHVEVDGAALLSEMSMRISEYIIMSPAAADAATLWVIHTHLIDDCHFTPRLFITSPDRRCGKSRLLQILGQAAVRPLNAGNISAAAVFRTVEALHPTFLLDEFDARGNDDGDMRGVINNGFERNNPFYRCAPTTLDPEGFDTFAPCAIAAIGKTWTTVEDRSITIRLHRKLPSTKVKKLRRGRSPELERLASMAARWAMDNAGKIQDIDPAIPEALNDRAVDIWEPLLASADLAGGDWPDRARRAALELSADGVIEDESYGVMLLADLRDFLKGQVGNAFSTKIIIEYLATLDERPWPSYGRARKTINAKQLADILKPFEVRSNTVRIGDGTLKGYQREDIEHAAGRYLVDSPVTTSQPAENHQKSAISPVTNEANVTGEKTLKPAQSVVCDVVTAGNGGNGAETPFDGQNDLSEDDDIEREAIQSEADFADTAAPTKSDPAPDEPQPREVKWTL